MASGPMNGFRALDLTDEKGLLCGKILADLGVDVIKVEKPGGDPARYFPPFYHDKPDPEKSLYWFAYNTNKRGITLDLETNDGQKSFKKLVESSDFVIESFPPGYLNKIGLGYATLSQINPRIIMTSITPFGQSGPFANFKASDIIVQAVGQMINEQGDPDRAPVRTSVPQAYMNAGADAAEGTMIAHYYRERTGRGQHVDVSAMESVLVAGHQGLFPWDVSRAEEKRAGSLMRHGKYYTPYIWECKDGWISFVLSAGKAGYTTNLKLTEWMDTEGMAPHLMKEKNWENWDWLQTTQDELDTIIKAISLFFKAHTAKELQEEALKRDIQLDKVCDSADTVSNVQLKARDFWVNIEHDELNDTIIYPGAFAKFSSTPMTKWRRAPLIGEHNNDILENGLDSSDRSSILSRQTEQPNTEIFEEPKKALNGLKVVGFVTAGVGPLLLKRLATHGGTVVLIESLKRPDITRTSSPYKDKPGINRSYRFALRNSDKYSLCLDLKHPRAGEVARRLVSWADVFVDNYRTGVMESWGLGYEEARAINPDIIMIGLSKEGHTGPNRRAAGYGGQMAGYAGFVSLTGWPDRPPVAVGAYPDIIAPRFGSVALLAALDYRRRTGKGQYIDFSEYEASIQFLIPAILDYTVNNRIQISDGNKCTYAAPHGVYRCKGDDKWCAIAVFTETEWSAFCKVIGSPAWTQASKFSALAGRKEHEDELNRLIGEWTVNHTAEEVMMMMQQAGVQAGVVRTSADIKDCPQLNYRHYWWTLEHPEIGKATYGGNSYILSRTPYQLQRPAPCFGEHTEYICTKLLGISDEELIELFQEGVFT